VSTTKKSVTESKTKVTARSAEPKLVRNEQVELHPSDSLFSLKEIRKSVGTKADDTKPRGGQNTVQVRKPNKMEFVRVHPDEDQRHQHAPVIEQKQSRSQDLYLLMGEFEVPAEIADCVSEVNLYRAMNHNGMEFVWAVKTGSNDWNTSAGLAVYESVEGWVRVKTGATSYEVVKCEAKIPEPKWSAQSFEQLVCKAFEGRLIRGTDHRVIQMLQGKVHGIAA
jgi:hypothetical protein